MKIKTCVVALLSVLILTGSLVAEEYISTFDMSGNMISTFAAGVPDGQMISFLEVDPNGDIWIGRVDTSHGTNQFNPNDEVVRFSPAGSELQIVKGPTRCQSAIGFDSLFNLYIGAIEDGGPLGDDYIYKFSQDGTYDSFFGSLNSEVEDFAVTTGDRIFLVTNNVMLLKEYSTAGIQLNNYQVNSFMGGKMALNGAQDRIWCLQHYNAPGGENSIAEYDLSLVGQSSFGLNPIGNPGLGGLEVLASGNLLTMDGNGGATFYEFDTSGALIDTFTLPELASARTFTLDNGGNLVVVHSNSLIQAPSVPAANEVGYLLLAVILAGASLFMLRRRHAAITSHP